MSALNRITPRGHRKYVFPSGTTIKVEDGEFFFYRGGREFLKEVFLKEDLRKALAFDPETQGWVIVVSRLRRYIREELSRIRVEGARLYSPLLQRR